ncbi:hypothetical protein [Pantoea stewartii]|nr:hypothetical protein [Pantoea stewartii]
MNYYEALDALYLQFVKKTINRKEYELRLAMLDAVEGALNG